MKVLLYFNPDKEISGEYLAKVKRLFTHHGVDFDCVVNDKEPNKFDYDAIFAVGGDGTLLRRTEIANRNNLPIIGINCGKLGFLSEFEANEIEEAVVLFKNNELIKDERLTLKVSYKDKIYYALNDAVISRTYEENKRMVVSVGVKIGRFDLQNITGDGVILATPTGSTAYSLSAGGAIISPEVSALCLTPIAAHSFSAKPFVCSAGEKFVLTHEGGAKSGLFVDGKLIDVVEKGDKVVVSEAERKTVFLRKKGFDFFARLNNKLQER